jgi:hypothetical protein
MWDTVTAFWEICNFHISSTIHLFCSLYSLYCQCWFKLYWSQWCNASLFFFLLFRLHFVFQHTKSPSVKKPNIIINTICLLLTVRWLHCFLLNVYFMFTINV